MTHTPEFTKVYWGPVEYTLRHRTGPEPHWRCLQSVGRYTRPYFGQDDMSYTRVVVGWSDDGPHFTRGRP